MSTRYEVQIHIIKRRDGLSPTTSVAATVEVTPELQTLLYKHLEQMENDALALLAEAQTAADTGNFEHLEYFGRKAKTANDNWEHARQTIDSLVASAELQNAATA